MENNKQNAEIARKVLERMGISGKPIPAEELQARMVRNGIPPDGNEFSRAIIEEREKKYRNITEEALTEAEKK